MIGEEFGKAIATVGPLDRVSRSLLESCVRVGGLVSHVGARKGSSTKWAEALESKLSSSTV